MAFFDFLKGDSKTAEEYFAEATEKIQNGLYNEAILSYNKAIKKDSNYTDAYHDRGFAKDCLGYYDGAIRDFDKAIELGAEDVMSYYNRARSKYSYAKEVTEAAGGSISYKNIFSEAIEDNLMALSLLDKNEKNPAYVPENIKQLIYLNNGLTRNSLEDFKLAIDDFTKAIKIDENYANAYQNRAVSHMCLENFNEALRDGEKAMELGNTLSQGIIEKALEAGGVNYLEGLNESFHENGKIKERFHVKNDKKEGLHQKYYKNGQIAFESKCVNDKVHGTIKAWHENGQQLSIAEFKDGICHGLCQHWWPCGQLVMEGKKINDQQHGLWRNWYQNGQLKSEGNWNHGFSVFDGVGGMWYENGNIEQEIKLIDGQIICKQYYTNGKLEKEIDFTSGEFISYLQSEPNPELIKRLMELVLWKETEEFGEEIEGILDEIGYVSPLPHSKEMINKLISTKHPEAIELANSFKLAIDFNKKKSKKNENPEASKRAKELWSIMKESKKK